MSDLTEEQLGRIMPRCVDAAAWTPVLNGAMARFQINTFDRIAAFLAQIAHESSELCALVENLNYSASRLMQVWPRRFPGLSRAQQYANNPEKLANYVYANRLGNGGSETGDGWRYRGRGLIQVTGRGNYRSVGQGIEQNLELSPELLEQPDGAALSAAYFWKSRGLNELADNHNGEDDTEDFVTISVTINGGRTGLQQRMAYWDRARKVLMD